MQITMQNGNLLVEPIVQDRTASGLFLSPSGEEDFQRGTVVASPNGSSFKQGVVVHYRRFNANPAHINEQKFSIVKEENILAVEENDNSQDIPG